MSQKPVLYVREGELAGNSYPIEGEKFTVGRGTDCSLTLPERQVSRYHAQFIPQDGKMILLDLGSKNGTHLNGKPVVGSAELRDGDEIQIALAVKMVYIGSDSTVPLSSDAVEPEPRLKLDEVRRTAIIAGRELNPPLSLAQFRLLKTLYDARGSVCERDQIIQSVWPGTDGWGVSEQAIDALVRRLRDRLAEIDTHNYIITVRGHGFRLDDQEGESGA